MKNTEAKPGDNAENTAVQPAKPSPNRRGPKLRLSGSKAKEIISRIEGGESLKEACRAVGQSLSGWYRGLAVLTEQNSEIRRQYNRAISANREAIKDEAIQTIRDAFAKDWRAASWWLERAYPAEFGRRQLELGGLNGGPIQTENELDLSKLTYEQIVALEGIIATQNANENNGAESIG